MSYENEQEPLLCTYAHGNEQESLLCKYIFLMKIIKIPARPSSVYTVHMLYANLFSVCFVLLLFNLISHYICFKKSIWK